MNHKNRLIVPDSLVRIMFLVNGDQVPQGTQ
jgi:hypothetical protein